MKTLTVALKLINSLTTAKSNIDNNNNNNNNNNKPPKEYPCTNMEPKIIFFEQLKGVKN